MSGAPETSFTSAERPDRYGVRPDRHYNTTSAVTSAACFLAGTALARAVQQRGENMPKRTLNYFLGVLFAGAALYAACGGDVTGDDCKVKCDDVSRTCVQKCNDEGCKSKCTTDAHDCSLKCDKVTATSNPDAG
jgi:hypothetical protein